VVISSAYRFILFVAVVGSTIWTLSNASYGAMLSTQGASNEAAEQQIEHHGQDLSGVSSGKAEKNIDASERRIAQLEPNPLTPEQQRTIIEQAKPPRGAVYQISITSDASCADCRRYARAFERALRDAGWLVRFNNAVGAGAGSSLRSVSLMVLDPANLASEAVVLQRALNSALIEFELIGMPRDFPVFPRDSRPILYFAANPRHR
jgi:glycine/D-amino acid oxidase-like deaminating enzyme